MAATVAALVASRLLFGRLLLAPVVTAAFVVIFGGLTLWLDDPTLHQAQADDHQSSLCGFLAFGLLTRRPLLKLLLGEAFKLTDEGWRKLSVRWAISSLRWL